MAGCSGIYVYCCSHPRIVSKNICFVYASSCQGSLWMREVLGLNPSLAVLICIAPLFHPILSLTGKFLDKNKLLSSEQFSVGITLNGIWFARKLFWTWSSTDNTVWVFVSEVWGIWAPVTVRVRGKYYLRQNLY